MARSFNGSSDLIDAGTNAILNPAAESFSAWVYGTSFPQAYQAIYSRNGVSAYSQLFVKSTGKLAIYLFGSNSVFYDPGTITVSTNTWTHLAFTYSNAVGMVGYVNGAVDSTVGSGQGALASVSANAVIGDDTGNANRFWTGNIADVALWNRVLTAGEVSGLSSGQRPYMIPNGLAGYWPLDGLQSPEPDLSGNVLNGTLTGTAFASGAPLAMFTPRPEFFPPFSSVTNLMSQIWM